MSAEVQEFESRLKEGWPELSDDARGRLIKYYLCVIDENSRQNLTRLVSPKDFYFGHIADVKELLGLGWLGKTAMDLGSGLGVPGFAAALVDPSISWVLAESETRKAEFLRKAALDLGVVNVEVVGRGEDALKTRVIGTVVCRAVGPIDRIYGWIRKCSTWNTLVLYKGPRWEQEHAEFSKVGLSRELKVESEHRYSVDDPPKSRVLVKIRRVPRGTR